MKEIFSFNFDKGKRYFNKGKTILLLSSILSFGSCNEINKHLNDGEEMLDPEIKKEYLEFEGKYKEYQECANDLTDLGIEKSEHKKNMAYYEEKYKEYRRKYEEEKKEFEADSSKYEQKKQEFKEIEDDLNKSY